MRPEETNSCIPSVQIEIWKEAKPAEGEDCVMHAFSREAGVLGVFDGCGGAGAQRHACYSQHTEAYMASRLVSGAFYDSFQDLIPSRSSGESQLRAYLARASERVEAVFSAYQPPAVPGGGVKGSMVRILPSTAAIFMIQSEQGAYRLSAVWAGDSRCYLLDRQGLAQLTRDDTSVPDPMDNLYEDGVLRNMIHAGKPMNLHVGTFPVKPPFAILAATDGCFGYFSTPMEFEGALLQTLQQAQSPEAWENLLAQRLGAVAGDDYTLSLAAYGFGSFAALQQFFLPRTEDLTRRYLEPLQELPLDRREPRQEMWAEYRETYLRYLKED